MTSPHDIRWLEKVKTARRALYQDCLISQGWVTGVDYFFPKVTILCCRLFPNMKAAPGIVVVVHLLDELHIKPTVGFCMRDIHMDQVGVVLEAIEGGQFWAAGGCEANTYVSTGRHQLKMDSSLKSTIPGLLHAKIKPIKLTPFIGMIPRLIVASVCIQILLVCGSCCDDAIEKMQFCVWCSRQVRIHVLNLSVLITINQNLHQAAQ